MPATHLSRRAVLAASATLITPASATGALEWRTLAPGLEHTTARLDASIGDRRLDAVRIDPRRNRFVLLAAGALNERPRTALQWANDHGLSAAINAGMFHPNRLPVGFAKSDGRVIQSRMNADRSVFVFGDDNARLLDLSCDAFEQDAHEGALQCIRMISCAGRNVWAQQARIWSIACLAQDTAGRILMLHARSPLSVHDFIEAIRALPLGISRAMYLEGGPEATLVARAGGQVIERFGSYETGFNENDDIAAAWPLPNILGVATRT